MYIFFSAAHFIFIITIIVSIIGFINRNILHKFIFKPYNVIKEKKIYLFLTSGIIHADIKHLLFNMLTFYFFAFDLERTIGELYFTCIYIGSLIISHIPTFLKHKNNKNYSSLGASGAISGIIFSSILIYPTNKIMILPIPLPLPSYIFGIIYILWGIIANKKANDNINHIAHISGAISGIIISFILFGNTIINIWQKLI